MIGDYTSNSITLPEDADLNPIFKIELDEATGEDLEVDLSFLGTAIFGGNYTVATQAPAAPSGAVLPANTSTCYFVYPDNPNSPAGSIPAGMVPCGSVVIPAGETYVEVQVVQQEAAPRPTGNSTVKIELMSSDRYEIDNDSATATISPRVRRNTYSTTFSSELSVPACPPANPGYTLTSQFSSSLTSRTSGTGFSFKSLLTYSNDPVGYILRTVDGSVAFPTQIIGIKIGNSWYRYIETSENGSPLTQAQQIAAFGAPDEILVLYSGGCLYTEI